MIYRYLTPDEIAALSPDEQARYARERRAFAAEVATLTEEARRTGKLSLGSGSPWVLRCGAPTAHVCESGRVIERP